MTLINENFSQKFANFRHFHGSILTILGVKKVRFLDLFRVVLELFIMCLGIFSGLKRSTFGYFSAPNVGELAKKPRLFVIINVPPNSISPLGSRGSPTKLRQCFPGIFIWKHYMFIMCKLIPYQRPFFCFTAFWIA